MSDAAKVAASVAGSTAEADYPGLGARVERWLLAEAGRAKAGGQSSQVRSDKLRARIRVAWQRRSLAGPIDRAQVRACLSSMEERGWHADARTIADELRILKAEEQAATEMQHARPHTGSNLTYRST
jgi:hypothetical protein